MSDNRSEFERITDNLEEDLIKWDGIALNRKVLEFVVRWFIQERGGFNACVYCVEETANTRKCLIDAKDAEISALKEKLKDREEKLARAVPFLHMAGMGGEMFCLNCHEGNDGESPEHTENCQLKALISEISQTKLESSGGAK